MKLSSHEPNKTDFPDSALNIANLKKKKENGPYHTRILIEKSYIVLYQ